MGIERYFKYRPYKSRKILLVDNEEDMGWILQKIIRDAGHRLIFASTFKEGIQKIKRLKTLEMAIIDLRLEEEDNGLTFIREAKTINPKVIFVMISAFEDVDIKNKARELGARHFMDKPINVVRLLDIINHDCI
jgi:DNA-binding NtrC family response regulator